LVDKVKFGILTLSDRASSGVYEDLSGPAIRACLESYLSTSFQISQRVIPDDFELIKKNLVDLCDVEKCSLVVTTGGTGPSKRDVTPEATEAICERMFPGFGELMRSVSLRSVPTAILSRQTAGTRGQTLIVNLPGKPASIKECLDAVFPAIPYCLELMGGPVLEGRAGGLSLFRPKK
jgi:molybdopterin adenylyltransferase